ncbi:MAG: cupin domain-containing protein [Oscillospiraceae bacterium]|jgi:quercetin dioxygenase-like cupin family protein|nr:cupin domain-containing protein [Oscillospiraceae bacterium]
MTEQLKDIGMRLRDLREIYEYSTAGMAARLEMEEADYIAYESGEKDFSFSFLYNCAEILGVDVLDIMSGESPKLNTCTVVKKGGGYAVNRRAAYDYRHLAFTFRNKKAEPFMVTVEPKEEVTPTLHGHEGQEFNYVVSGKMQLYIGEISYVLEEGDSAYFDSSIPHAMRALDNRAAKFLAVVLK